MEIESPVSIVLKTRLTKAISLAMKDKDNISVSQHVKNAIRQLKQDPQMLARALIRRLEEQQEFESVSCSLYLNNELLKTVNEAASKTNLSRDEVVRLMIEAYIHKL